MLWSFDIALRFYFLPTQQIGSRSLPGLLVKGILSLCGNKDKYIINENGVEEVKMSANHLVCISYDSIVVWWKFHGVSIKLQELAGTTKHM